VVTSWLCVPSLDKGEHHVDTRVWGVLAPLFQWEHHQTEDWWVVRLPPTLESGEVTTRALFSAWIHLRWPAHNMSVRPEFPDVEENEGLLCVGLGWEYKEDWEAAAVVRRLPVGSSGGSGSGSGGGSGGGGGIGSAS
jgi:uncharacterized membrane protein YgcG